MRTITECDSCQDRTATCHATCQIHRKEWEARRKRNDQHLKSRVASDYTIDMVKKTKGGASFSKVGKYRPKERKL